MTATNFTRVPLMAGSAIASSVGRFGLWSFAHYMRAPLASTGLMVMVTLTALAGSNALYFQTVHHPAPLFAPSTVVPQPVLAGEPEIVTPMAAPQRVPAPSVSADTTGSVAPAAPVVPSAPVGNTDVFAVQKKLTELGLFDGAVDGYYGPRTARAIRAFEERNGMTPMGAVTPAVMEAILRADAAGLVPASVVAAAAQPVVPRPAPPQDQLVGQAPGESVIDTVGNAAEQTLDSIISAVDGGRQTPPPAPAIKPVPPVSIQAGGGQPMPAPVQVASLEPMTASAPVAVPAVPAATLQPANDPALITQVQRGLASLGFYHAPIDGRPGEDTAKAIRSFEVFHNYQMTGKITPGLPGLLRAAGAEI